MNIEFRVGALCMTKQPQYRYFLGIKVDPQWLPSFQRIGNALGLQIRLDLLHLTLCVVAETAERDWFVSRRISRALDGRKLPSFAVNLSRIQASQAGVYARSFGPQDDIQDFYRLLVRLLQACEIEPLHRKSGLHPHVTLWYRSCQAALLKVAVSWCPTELLLIESKQGASEHTILRSWLLCPPRQPELPFGPRLPRLRRAG